MGNTALDADASCVNFKEQLLKDTGLSVRDVPPDGDCQFHCFKEGVELLGGKVRKPVRYPGVDTLRHYAR